MTTTDSILQCGLCHRQHDGAGALRPFRVCIPALAPCGRDDCDEVVASILLKESARLERRIERRSQFHTHGGKPVGRSGNRRAESGERRFETQRECRSPLPPETERDFVSEVGGQGSEVSGAQAVDAPNLLSPGARQDDYQASGAADSANERLKQFLMAPQNRGLWFSTKVLMAIAKSSVYINNRAVDLRKELVELGLYLDQCNLSESDGGPKTSHYRLCKIEEALSLSAEVKLKLIKGPV